MAYFEREQNLAWTFVSHSRFLGDFSATGAKIVTGSDTLLLDPNGASARVDVAGFALVAKQPGRVRGHLMVPRPSPDPHLSAAAGGIP